MTKSCPGERRVETVERELLEETGLAARVGGPCAVFSDVMGIPSTEVRLHSVRLCYRVWALGDGLRDEADGSTDLAQWLPFAEARRVTAMAPFVTAAIERPARESVDGHGP